jgi:hypothetical protein
MNRPIRRRVLPLLAATSVCAAALLGSGCITASMLQTARTLEPGKSQISVSAWTTSDLRFLPGVTSYGASLSPPGLEVSFREGVAPHAEVGGRMSPFGTYAIDGKYQFVDHDGVAMSVGVIASYHTPWTEGGSLGIATASIPVIASYDLAPHFAVYAAARLTEAVAHWSGTTYSTWDTLLSGSFGVKLGITIGVLLEFTWGHFFIVDPMFDDFHQWSAAVFWNF